jgi:Family of unknown function (DUF6267)
MTTLLEGGNVFKAPTWSKENPEMLTDRISKAEVAPTVAFLNKLTGMNLTDNLLGSTGIAESSGDIDIAIDMSTSKDEFVQLLTDKGVSPDHIRKTGDSVHYMSPIFAGKKKTNRFVQVDFMFVPSVEFAKWSMRTAPESTYKGVYLQKLRADLTNTVAPKDAQGKSLWKWNHFKGVLNRSDDTPVFREFDPDDIAQGLLGPSATRKDLESVEGIMRLLKDNAKRKDVIDTYRQTLARDKKGTQLPPDEELDRDYLEEAPSAETLEKLKALRAEFKELADAARRKAKAIDNAEHIANKQQVNELKVGDATKRLMRQQKDDKKQSSVGREFQHIEDLVYIEGISGVKRALLRLAQIAKNSKPLEVKWDGSPAIVFGRDSTGKFHFGDKYAKEMLSTAEEVYAYYTRTSQSEGRVQFAKEMAQLCPVYEAATPENFTGFLEAGLMYKSTPPKNERGEYYFAPNTVTYFVDSSSELGKRIGNSISGAAATGTFDGLPALGGKRRPVGDSYRAITGSQVVIIPPKFTDTQTDINPDKLRTISRYAASVAQPLEAFIAPEQGLSDIRGIIYTYVNSQVDDPSNLDKLGHNFLQWLATSKVSAAKQEKIKQRVQENPRGFNAVFKLTQAIMHIKDDIIGKKEHETLASLGIRAQLKSGEHGGEGFVHDPDEGQGPTKLVNRGTFTRANRLREDEHGEKAVVGWGRGMGHKGHMYLAQSVIEYAERTGAQPIFYVSETVGADDPLTAEEKLAIYKKVFPKHKAIFKSAKTINAAAQEVYDAGYTEMTLVVGADQKNAFQFLARPTKSTGQLPIPFDKVQVISRQDTDSETSHLEGPRATPMRDVLKDPNASDEDKFSVWRDAMPDALTDNQVLATMRLAAKRLGLN